MFHDRRLSRDGSTACITCHEPARTFADGRAFFWDARIATLEEHVLKPIEDPNEMDLTVEEAAAPDRESPSVARL